MKRPSLLVADDHPLLLKGLVDELSHCGYTEICGVSNGAKALEHITEHQPDIAILDIEMPLISGFEVIKKATESEMPTKFIILTSHKEKAFVVKAKKLNISGYLLKDEPFSEIEACIKEVQNGNEYFSKTFHHIFEKKVTPEIEKIKFLSPSERTIVRLIAQGKNTNEIADLLSISPRTVQKHRTNIINKLDLPNGVDALSIWTSENKEIILSI